MDNAVLVLLIVGIMVAYVLLSEYSSVIDHKSSKSYVSTDFDGDGEIDGFDQSFK